MSRVCLITPGHLATNPRIVKEADALCAAGYDVAVITGDYLEWGRGADAEFLSRAWRVVHKAPFGPLAPRVLRFKQRIGQELACKLSRLGVSAPAAVNRAWHPITPALIEAARQVAADLYIAHYPAALPAAALAARKHGARYAFDAEDFHLGDPPEDKAFELQRRLTRAIEQRYLANAAYVTAASPGIAAAYAKAYSIPTPAVVLNVFAKAEGPAAASACGSASPRPSLYWFSQTIGANRGLECAVEAIGRAQSRPHLFLRGHVAADFDGKLKQLARTFGAESRLHLLAPEQPSQMVRLAAQYDLGLAAEIGETPNHNISLSNKLFTYLLAGVPIVASGIDAHIQLAAELGEAMRIFPKQNAAELALALDEVLLDPQRLATARAASFAAGQNRFNWDIEAQTLLRLVGAALAPNAAALDRSSKSAAKQDEASCVSH